MTNSNNTNIRWWCIRIISSLIFLFLSFIFILKNNSRLKIFSFCNTYDNRRHYSMNKFSGILNYYINKRIRTTTKMSYQMIQEQMRNWNMYVGISNDPVISLMTHRYQSIIIYQFFFSPIIFPLKISYLSHSDISN